MSRLIDADALKANINTSFWSEIGKLIDDAPTIYIVRCKDCEHTARPKGEWQMDKDDDIYHCSKCFFEIDASGCIDPTEYISIYNFCPNCGADMRERKESE